LTYGVGNKGAAWLKKTLALSYRQLNWKNHIGKLFLEHTLLVSEVMVALELACRSQSDIRLLWPDENKVRPFQWSVDVGDSVKCGVIPDRVFGLECTDKSGRRVQSWFLLEADRGTMPVERTDLNQSSFQRKLLAYRATWAQHLHRVRFGWNRFRVLTITSNPKRIENMQRAVRSLNHGRGLFLFLDAKRLSEEKDFFALRWQTSRDAELVGLLD